LKKNNLLIIFCILTIIAITAIGTTFVLDAGAMQNANAMESPVIIAINDYKARFSADGFFGFNLLEDKPQKPLVLTTRAQLEAHVKNLLRDFKSSFGSDCDSVRAMLADYHEATIAFYAEYSEAFFKENILVIAHVASGSGRLDFNVDKIELCENNNILNIYVNQITPAILTMDYQRWFLLLEVDREASEGVSGIREARIGLEI